MNARLIVMLLLAVFAELALAHGGRVDREGCHRSGRSGHHCHADRAGGKEAANSAESSAARDRRLKRECKGAVNAGVCLGYTR